MGTALVVVHDIVPGRGERVVGTVGPALVDLGFDVVVTTFLTGRAGVPEPDRADLMVVLGSAEAAYDDTVPWLAAELDHLARAIGHGTPILGICFGAQALARVLGASVGPAPRSEHGFVTLGSAAPDLLPRGKWLQFHDDAFNLPAGAALVARNDVGLQAFTCGPHLGVQFHPEITPDVLDAWAESWVEAGDHDAVAASVDLPALAAEVAARAHTSAAACRDLVSRFCAHAGLSTRAATTPGRAGGSRPARRGRRR